MKQLAFALAFLFSLILSAQYWQQKVDYTMTVELDAETADYTGTQQLVYTNNSPETLTKVFYHLYFKPFFRFIKHYIIQLGFLDGKVGFIISIIMAWGVFLRYVKIKEKQIFNNL